MEVIAFVVFYSIDARGRRRRGGLEREALLPFDDEPTAPRPGRAEPRYLASHDQH
jgi:hypothetical protein